MYGEPSAYEYGEAIDAANKAVSTNGFTCLHHNAGWCGYYIKTPKGNEYQLVKKLGIGERGYFLCEYSSMPFSHGKSLEIEFDNIETCKEYLITREDVRPEK